MERPDRHTPAFVGLCQPLASRFRVSSDDLGALLWSNPGSALPEFSTLRERARLLCLTLEGNLLPSYKDSVGVYLSCSV